MKFGRARLSTGLVENKHDGLPWGEGVCKVLWTSCIFHFAIHLNPWHFVSGNSTTKCKNVDVSFSVSQIAVIKGSLECFHCSVEPLTGKTEVFLYFHDGKDCFFWAASWHFCLHWQGYIAGFIVRRFFVTLLQVVCFSFRLSTWHYSSEWILDRSLGRIENSSPSLWVTAQSLF